MEEDIELKRLREKKIKELLRKSKIEVKISVNDSDFNEKVINTSKDVPVVVDFWAEWCVPCKMLGPIIEEIADEFNGKFVLAKLNVDENPLMSNKYGIRSIPNVKLFKNGEVVDEFIGLRPKNFIEEWIMRNLK